MSAARHTANQPPLTPRDSVFVDSSAFYALADRGDTLHRTAVRIAQRLRGADLVTTEVVLAETWHLTRSRLGRDAAVLLWRSVRDGAARVDCLLHEDLERAWTIAADFADQDFSLSDCASFAYMVRNGIARAFSFDRHFALFRHGLRRRLSFEVLGLDTPQA